MATVTRPKAPIHTKSSPLLSNHVPSPFPREQLYQMQADDSLVSEDLFVSAGEQVAKPSQTAESDSDLPGVLSDIMPSIAFVQRSCLTTLNNLLSVPTRWNPIVPDRRHSMPSSPHNTTFQHGDAESSSSALHTLVINLRNRDREGEMIEARDSVNDSDLIHELKSRVESISSSLQPSEAVLAKALVSLLSNFNRLSIIQSGMHISPFETPELESSRPYDEPPPIDYFDALKRQLNDLQTERLVSQGGMSTPGIPTTLEVEISLLWTRIDQELETVVAMCKERTENLPRFFQDNLPPQYDDEAFDLDSPPVYESGGRGSIDDSKAKTVQHQPSSSTRQTDEKMRSDLEAVAMAIDRLYLVAPQLHNQRVELKSTKLIQMEKARQEGVSSVSMARSSKGKERDVKELENILELLGKASERSLKGQSVILDGGMQSRLEKAKLRDVAKREAFVEQLVRHSGAGRMYGQDAVLQPRVKDPEALLTLPEFIRECLPPNSEQLKDPETLLTLPEFVKELPPVHITEDEITLPPIPTTKSKKKSRHRSLSAPPLAWLRGTSSSKANSSQSSNSNISHAHLQPKFGDQSTSFDVVYVAENHENLQHVLVFFTVTGGYPGVDLEAEVLPPFPEHPSEGGDHLLIKSGPPCSLPLLLPARTAPGKKAIQVQNGHYEIKLTTLSSSSSSDSSEPPTPLLDASHLLSMNPTSFICASCSLPLIQSTKIDNYRDLPSEHWEELVEAWMCHADQSLHEQVVKNGKAGFWPSPGQALVGGSYILFDNSAMSTNNLYLAKEASHDDNWHLARCLCGAVFGRCQEKPSLEGDVRTVYRVLKYAVRPVSSTAECLKIPLSAFIVEDMTEFIQAHASYRFIISDEEEERPRILLWLFKPRIRLAYTTPTSRAIPKSASIVAAKVLYKLIAPSDGNIDLKSLLNKYPGFPQAEYLSYPMSVCRRLAGYLKQSNTAYPERLRMMTGLEVGWLQRV